MGQAGIPLFYLQGMGGGAILKFRDLFNDTSQYWAWRKFLGVTPGTKTGIEANGRYSLYGGIEDCRWNAGENQAPRLFVGALSTPCEIITRLDTFGGNLNTMAGLFICPQPTRFGGSFYWAIQRRKDPTLDGIAVVQNNGIQASVAGITTLPIWFRIRLGSTAFYALTAYFDYSLDGLNWTNLFTQNTGSVEMSIYGGMDVGLYVSNLTNTPFDSCSGGFDHFLMKPKSIN